LTMLVDDTCLGLMLMCGTDVMVRTLN